MATLEKIAADSGLSLRSIRKLHKLGYLLTTSVRDPFAETLASSLAKHNRLTTFQLLQLYKRPELAEKHDCTAEVRALGDVAGEAAPWIPVGMRIEMSASRDPVAIAGLAEWIKSFLDAKPAGYTCDHAALGCRLLYNCPDAHLVRVAGKFRTAMWNVRGQLGGRMTIDAKNRTIYHARKPLDL
jgi:hypothetical protein